MFIKICNKFIDSLSTKFEKKEILIFTNFFKNNFYKRFECYFEKIKIKKYKNIR